MTKINTITKKDIACRGFTLIELIVVVSIFSFLTTVILVNHTKFSSAILIESLAYDVALSIREAQIFGLSAKEFEVGSGEFQAAYGVHFDASTPTQYTIWADRGTPRNGMYNPFPICGDTGSECIEVFTIQRGNYIDRFCATLPTGVERCSPALSYLDILFVRPDPDALITSNFGGEEYSPARIFIRSPKGNEREVMVWITGQISIPQ